MFVPIEIANVITGLTDQLLDRETFKILPKDTPLEGQNICRPGLMFEVQVRVALPDRSAERSAQLFFVLTGNTSVWVACGDLDGRQTSYTDIGFDKWENTCDHDSCWRSEGVERPLIKAYFSLAGDLDPNIAPANMEVSATFGWLNSPIFSNVEVIYTSTKGRQKLLAIREAAKSKEVTSS